jgi:hypothetical protein
MFFPPRSPASPPPLPPRPAQPSPTGSFSTSETKPLCQILCPQMQALRSNTGLQIVTQRVGDLDLIGDTATGTFRPLVPRDLRQQVFDHLLGAAHPGMQATRRLIASRCVLKGLSTDVTAWARECLHCQEANVHRHIQVPPQHIPVPTRHFIHIHMDLVGPLHSSKGFTHLFTSRWPEAIPIAATTTADCANSLFQGWMSTFWVPAVITSDRGPQFTSPPCGPPCATCSSSSTPRQQHTIRSPTGWWNPSTAAPRTPSGPAVPQ